MLTRRTFLAGLAALRGARRRRVHSVTGPVDSFGPALAHEHLFLDEAGADKGPTPYDEEEAVRVILPHLEQVRRMGFRTVVDCTPAFIGRNPRLLRRLARAARLRIITNTGYYGAAGGRYVPAHAREETAAQLAARWTAEFRSGIEGTGILPGFIKTGVNAGPLSEMDAKLVRAAALARRATGLAIFSHTGDGLAAEQELTILEEERVPLGAFIWVHAQNEKDTSAHLAAARRGAWVAFDHFSAETLEGHLALVENMARHGLLGRVLISHDAGWYRAGVPGGGRFRPFDTIFQARARLPFRRLMIENPWRALAGVS